MPTDEQIGITNISGPLLEIKSGLLIAGAIIKLFFPIKQGYGLAEEGGVMENLVGFLSHFHFNPKRRRYIGVEREYMLTYPHFLPLDWCEMIDPQDPDPAPTPKSEEFLRLINDPRWTYELSACQVEHRTLAHSALDVLRDDLMESQARGRTIARQMSCKLEAREVWPSDMTLEIYKDDERYARIAPTLPREVLSAACRVTGVHIHVGMSSIEEAIEAHNIYAERLPELIAMGDHSHGERVKLYKMMAPRWQPVCYASAEHFYEVAVEQGFAENPRDCWNMVRISRHGTVEVRAFGMTDKEEEIIGWAQFLLSIIP